jgi:hypothetical protein
MHEHILGRHQGMQNDDERVHSLPLMLRTSRQGTWTQRTLSPTKYPVLPVTGPATDYSQLLLPQMPATNSLSGRHVP